MHGSSRASFTSHARLKHPGLDNTSTVCPLQHTWYNTRSMAMAPTTMCSWTTDVPQSGKGRDLAHHLEARWLRLQNRHLNARLPNLLKTRATRLFIPRRSSPLRGHYFKNFSRLQWRKSGEHLRLPPWPNRSRLLRKHRERGPANRQNHRDSIFRLVLGPCARR